MFALEINPQKDGADGERENPGRSRRKTIKRRGLFLFFLSRHHGFRQHLNPKRTMRQSRATVVVLWFYSARHWGLILSSLFFLFSFLFAFSTRCRSLPPLCSLPPTTLLFHSVLSTFPLFVWTLASVYRACLCVCVYGKETIMCKSPDLFSLTRFFL